MTSNVETNPPVQKRSLLAKVFLSPDEPRLRAGWRLLAQTFLFFVFTVIFAVPIGILTLFVRTGQGMLAVFYLVELLAATASVFLARLFLDRRSISSLGLKLDWRAAADLAVGTAIPFVVMGLIYWIEWSLGWLTFEGFAWGTEAISSVALNLMGAFLFFIAVGWNEELTFRGYYLQTIASGLNPAWGVFLSSLIFGLAHSANPGAGWSSAVGILFAGLFLAYAYLRTGQLWLSIGLHIGWNFFEGPFFGFPVSGLDFFRMTRITVDGPVLWTGGAFGPEAGLIILPALLAGVGLVWLYTRGRKTE